MRPSKTPRSAHRKTLMPLLLLVLSLSGCANQLPTIQACPAIPAPPPLTEPPPSVPYSESVRLLLLEWQKKLTHTQVTP